MYVLFSCSLLFGCPLCCVSLAILRDAACMYSPTPTKTHHQLQYTTHTPKTRPFDQSPSLYSQSPQQKSWQNTPHKVHQVENSCPPSVYLYDMLDITPNSMVSEPKKKSTKQPYSNKRNPSERSSCVFILIPILSPARSTYSYTDTHFQHPSFPLGSSSLGLAGEGPTSPRPS